MRLKTILLKNFKFSLLKNKNCLYTYLYTNIYYIIIKNNTRNTLHLNSTCSLLIIIKNTLLRINVKSIFKYFLVQFIKYQAYKIKFTGKGYKIKKPTKKSFRFLFNKSHLCII